MQPFKGIVTGIGVIVLAQVLFACAGSQSNLQDETAAVKEETLPAAAPTSAPSPRPVATSTDKASSAEAGERSDKIKFIYEDIYFNRGSTRLDSAAQNLLDKKASWLRTNPGVKVVIEGHTDFKGSKEYNLALGDRRSGAVKSYLMRQGVARERLVAISYGKERPAVTGRTEEDRAKNRRVHFVIEEK